MQLGSPSTDIGQGLEHTCVLVQKRRPQQAAMGQQSSMGQPPVWLTAAHPDSQSSPWTSSGVACFGPSDPLLMRGPLLPAIGVEICEAQVRIDMHRMPVCTYAMLAMHLGSTGCTHSPGAAVWVPGSSLVHLYGLQEYSKSSIRSSGSN